MRLENLETYSIFSYIHSLLSENVYLPAERNVAMLHN